MKTKDWGPVENIGVPVLRSGGLGVRYPGYADPRTLEQREADRALFKRDPAAYIRKVRGEDD